MSGQYFDRRGEINELRGLLKNAVLERDISKLGDAVRKVITYMTLGIDLSKLFSEMIMACCTSDILVKKLVYLYLVTYAETNPDLSILAVNTLQKDCKDDDPAIRGLALRSLCSIRINNIMEYLEPAIREGLRDPNPYVRKTAALGVCKLDKHRGHDFESTLQNLIHSDPDLEVVSNAVSALVELHDGSFTVTPLIISRVMTGLPLMSEWAQCNILCQILSRYIPQSDDELFTCMNVLEVLLRTSSAAVVLEAAKLMIFWTQSHTELHGQVLERLRLPLLTLAACASCSEVAHAVFSQILVLIQSGYSHLFVRDLDEFCLEETDSGAVKILKAHLLAQLAVREPTVAAQAIEEISWAARQEGHDEVQVSSITCLESAAVAQSNLDASVVMTLSSLIAHDLPSPVVSAALCSLRDLSRRFASEIFSSPLESTILDHPLHLTDEGEAALLWFLGQWPSTFPTATRYLSDKVQQWHAIGSHVKLELMSSCLRVFLKKPREMLETLSLMWQESHDDENLDVADMARMYSTTAHCGLDKLSSFFHSVSSVACVPDEIEYLPDLASHFNALAGF